MLNEKFKNVDEKEMAVACELAKNIAKNLEIIKEENNIKEIILEAYLSYENKSFDGTQISLIDNLKCNKGFLKDVYSWCKIILDKNLSCYEYEILERRLSKEINKSIDETLKKIK